MARTLIQPPPPEKIIRKWLYKWLVKNTRVTRSGIDKELKAKKYQQQLTEVKKLWLFLGHNYYFSTNADDFERRIGGFDDDVSKEFVEYFKKKHYKSGR